MTAANPNIGNAVTQLARPEIVAMKPYSSARSEAVAKGILLNANEAPQPLIDDPQAAAEEVDTLNRYPQPQHVTLIERLAGRYNLPADHILLTRGSDDGIDLLLRVFCRAGIDSVLDTPPSFGMYRIAAQIQGAGFRAVARDPETLELDHGAIIDAVSDDRPPRLVFVTSPANPTGDVVDPAFMADLLAATRGRSIVVVDEAYSEFTSVPSFAAQVPEFAHLVVLRTLSKAFASAGLRCGAVLAQPEVIGLLRRVIPPYPIPSPVLSLALGLFEESTLARQAEMLEEVARNKQLLLRLLEGRPFVRRIWQGEANFVLARVEDAPSLVAHCKSVGVTIREFAGAEPLANCVRITVGSEEDLRRLGDALNTYQAQRREQADG